MQDPLISLVTGQPLSALDVLFGGAVLEGLPQPKHVTGDLRANTSLGAQTRNPDDRGQDTPDLEGGCGCGCVGIRQKRTVVRGENVHGQVGMALTQLVVQLDLEGPVDGIPECSAAGDNLVGVAGVDLARGRRRDGVKHFPWQAFAEGAEAIDGARDPVERDALQPDFAHQARRFRARERRRW